jgi:hypothetical protein
MENYSIYDQSLSNIVLQFFMRGEKGVYKIMQKRCDRDENCLTVIFKYRYFSNDGHGHY